MLAQPKCLKRAFHSGPGGQGFLFSLLTQDASIRSLAGKGMLHLSEASQPLLTAKGISGPPLPSLRCQQLVFPGGLRVQEGSHLGRVHTFI
jgi:hypothetical protein